MGRSMAYEGRYRGLLIGLRAQGDHLAQGPALRASLAGRSVNNSKVTEVTQNSDPSLARPLSFLRLSFSLSLLTCARTRKATRNVISRFDSVERSADLQVR